LEVELVRHLEQRSVAMPTLAFGRMQGPRRVAGERVDARRRGLNLELGAELLAHRLGEGEFPGLDAILRTCADRGLAGHCGAVERGCAVRLDRTRRVALHEEPFAVVQ